MTTIAARRRFETRPQRARRRSLTFEVSRARSLRSTWVLLVLGAVAGATTLVSGSLADLTQVEPSPADAISVLTSATSGASVVCGIFGALSAGHEYRYGLFGLSATLFPRRSDLLVGKVLGAMAFAVLTCSAALVVGLGASWLTGKDHLVSAITSEPGTVLLASGRSIMVCIGYLLIGIAATVMCRGVLGGVVVPLGMANIVEPVLALVVGRGGLWGYVLPFQDARRAVLVEGATLLDLGDGVVVTPSASLACFAFAVAVTLSAAWASFIRQDVT